MTKSVDTIANAIAARKQPGQRFIVAIAGAPGAGKSTLAETFCDRLNRDDAPGAAVVPMDGFRLDNAILEARDLLAVKGSPEPLDADGFAALLLRIHPGNKEVIVPVFDRDLDVARAGARPISTKTEIIIVEGNYLLLDRPEWAQLAAYFDLSIFLDVPIATLEIRLIEHDGSVTDLVSSDAGKRLNSPNDVGVKSDGSIWFTNPTYGIDSDYEGHQAVSSIGASCVYRVDPETGKISAIAADFSKPNGLAFSRDDTQLFVSYGSITRGLGSTPLQLRDRV